MKQVWALAAAVAALIATGACRDNSRGEFTEVDAADDPPTQVSAAGTGAQEKERPPEKGMVMEAGELLVWKGAAGAPDEDLWEALCVRLRY